MALTVDELGKTLIATGLLTADDLTTLWSELTAENRTADPAALAKLLVERGKLTVFQGKELLAGRGARLVLGDYVVVEEIGAGGMGRVYKAQHRRMHRMVALKVMSAAAMKDEASVKRFQREVRAAARLEHPNIVTAYASGESGAVKYLVMQFVDGPDLSSIVKKNGPLPVERAVDFIIQAARGLAYAHGEGVVHRDIKPANLLVDKKGVVKILDMGLARIESSDDGLTATEQVMGTVDYMSPEQASNTKGADARADIYSLGCTLWFLLTGKKLYEADTMIARLMAHRDGPLPSLVKTRDDASWALEQALHRMIAKRPDDRYQTMDDVAAALAPFGASGNASSGSGSGGSSVHNAELAAFMQGPAVAVGSSSKDLSKSKVTTGATAQLTSPEVGTDAKRKSLSSSTHLAPGLAPAGPNSADLKKPRGQAPRLNKKNTPLLIGGGAIGVVVVGIVAWLATRGDDVPAQPPVAAAAAVAVNRPTPPPAASGQTSQPATTAFPIVISAAQGDAVAEKLESTKYVWSIPENLGRGVNDGGVNLSPSLTADQLCLLVDSDVADQSDLVEYRRTAIDQPWGSPIYSTGSDGEERPFLSGDGLELIFNSPSMKRPGYVGGQDLNLRRRASRDAPWGPPENLGSSVNTTFDEVGGCLSPNGLFLAFSSNRPGGQGDHDIYVASRASRSASFGPAQSLGRTINTPGFESFPHLIDDSGRLYFERHGEIFLIFRNAAGATGAISLPNQPERFFESWLSPDGGVLYFHSDRRGGLGGPDVWMTRRVLRDSPEATRVPPPVEPEKPPPVDAVAFNGHAYQWVRIPGLSWFDAERISLAMGGHLVAVNSAEEDAWLKSTLLQDLPVEYMAWIGGLKESDGVWKWNNGEPMEYAAWNPTEGGDGGVAAAGIAHGPLGYGWADWGASARAVAQAGPIVGKSRNRGFIVEWDAPEPTKPKPPEPEIFNGHRYLLVSDGLHWPDAKAAAESQGGHLLTINDEAERTFIQDRFWPRVPFFEGTKRIYLGGFQENLAAPWQWVTGEPFDRGLWLGKGPNDVNEAMHVLTWDQPISWDDVAPTWRRLPYVIEWDTAAKP